MNINEKAKEYAEGKALEAITTAIEEAYASGYKEGYEAGLAAQEPAALEEENDGVEYVDLGLPSGTLWSNGFLKNDNGEVCHLSYQEASELNIPTKEQFEELLGCCEYIDSKDSFCYLGRSGRYIRFYNIFIEKAGEMVNYGTFQYWLKDEQPLGDDRRCVWGNGIGGYITSSFMGWKMPVFLVKTKDK